MLGTLSKNAFLCTVILKQSFYLKTSTQETQRTAAPNKGSRLFLESSPNAQTNHDENLEILTSQRPESSSKGKYKDRLEAILILSSEQQKSIVQVKILLGRYFFFPGAMRRQPYLHVSFPGLRVKKCAPNTSRRTIMVFTLIARFIELGSQQLESFVERPRDRSPRGDSALYRRQYCCRPRDNPRPTPSLP